MRAWAEVYLAAGIAVLALLVWVDGGLDDDWWLDYALWAVAALVVLLWPVMLLWLAMWRIWGGGGDRR